MEIRRGVLRFTLALFLMYPISTAYAYDRPLIVVSLYPIADLVHDLVGDMADVYSITPKGVWVHTYIVTSEDIDKTRSADAFIAVGAEEFLSQLPIPDGSLILEGEFDEYGIRYNSSWGVHGFRFYLPDLRALTLMLADYLGNKFPWMNDTIRQNAMDYIRAVDTFGNSTTEFPKGSVIASFPIISYMCLSLNVTPYGPIMPGDRNVPVSRPIVSFIESKGTPVDDAIRSAASEKGVPVFYVETFSADPLTELYKAAAVILGASTADIYVPSTKQSTNQLDYILILLILGYLLYFSSSAIYASKIRRRKVS